MAEPWSSLSIVAISIFALIAMVLRLKVPAFIALLVVALAVAGVVSYWASGHPDGLEFVAEETGFLGSAEDSATSGSPFADYQTTGVDGWLSGAIPGVLGTLLVLLVAGGAAWVVRRRGADRVSGIGIAMKKFNYFWWSRHHCLVNVTFYRNGRHWHGTIG